MPTFYSHIQQYQVIYIIIIIRLICCYSQIFYAAGYFSWRNTDNGSWYIQSLIKELNENGKEYNMLTLLTFVSQRVAVDYESNVPSNPLMDRQKQIPCVTSMLTRILRFNDKPPYSQAG